MNVLHAVHEGVINLRPERKFSPPTPCSHAVRADFCRIFSEDMQSLYLLAFLLTASHADAEQCFAAAFEEALNGRAVSEDRARYWSRRLVIKQAIRMMALASAQADQEPDRCTQAESESPACMMLSAIARLASLERVVFVMSVLEHYSEWECVSLLDRSRKDIQAARTRALQQLPTLFHTSLLPALAEYHDRNRRPHHEYERSRS